MTPTSHILESPGIPGRFKRLADSVLKELFDLAKHKAGFELKKWKAANHADTIYRRVRQLRMVKTILQSEKEVELTSFYVPSKVLIGEHRSVISQLSDISSEVSVLVEGTVGQGKSIFLRYLASAEFCKTRRIPIFIELRRYRAGTTLEEMMLRELQTLGFEMTSEVLHFFAEEGRLLLMLDAFDEVKEELREDLVTEIESLLRRHEALRAVVTSRPESGLSNSPWFRVFKLCPLVAREYELVIERMAHTKAVSSAIVAGIRSDASPVGHLLTTPLMVALLVIRYKVDQSLPQNSAAFYDSLFGLLLQRHDKTKGGYIRPRKSNLADSVLEEFFNALSFVSRKAGENSFSRSRLNELGKEALVLSSLNKGLLDSVLADVLEITCMIVTDGEECRFIHKSLQEYHAALFIKRQPDEGAAKFYTAMHTKWRSWEQELAFLSVIDRYRFLKYFQIPELTAALKVEAGGPRLLVGKTTAELICGNDKVHLEFKERTRMALSVGSSGKFWSGLNGASPSGYVGDMFLTMQKLPEAEWPVKARDGRGEVSIKDLLEDERFKSDVQKACDKLSKMLFAELDEAEKFIAHIESMKSVLDF